MSEEAFPFLSLPGEVRSIIYRNALVAQDSVHILDMHPDQYMTMKRSAKRFRDRYQTARTVCTAKAGIGFSCQCTQSVCPHHRLKPYFFKTIYTGDAVHNSSLSPALLRTNKEVR